MAESPNSWSDPSTLVGGGGLLAIVAAAAKTVLDWRKDRGQQRQSSEDLVRDDLMKAIEGYRLEIARLSARCDVLTERMDAMRERETEMLTANANLRAENQALRDRDHRILDYVQALVSMIDTDRRERGLPPLTGLPLWIDQRAHGVTQRETPPTEDEIRSRLLGPKDGA